MKRSKQKCSLGDAIWTSARAGGRLVVIPALDDVELALIAQKLKQIRLDWTTESGNDLFFPDDHSLIVFVPPSSASELERFTGSLMEEIGTPFLISTGLQIALFESVLRDGEVLASVRWPFFESSHMSEFESGHLQLEFETIRPAMTRHEWFRQLRAAFRQIQGDKRFTFKETDDEHNS